MKLDWPKLASLVQQTCKLSTISSLVCPLLPKDNRCLRKYLSGIHRATFGVLKLHLLLNRWLKFVIISRK